MNKSRQNACRWMAVTSIFLLPIISFAKAKPMMTTDLLQHLKKGEPWDRGVLTATKMVMFQQAASGGTDATAISKITLSYFTSANCSGTGQGTNPGSFPDPSYTTPDGTSFTIAVGTPFGMVAASAWNVGSTQLSIGAMNSIQSIAVTLKSTNNSTPQANFSGVSFACIPVTCTAGPSGECTSGSGTQSFTLKTTAAIGDPADGGVIASLAGLIATQTDNSTGIEWGGFGITTSATSDIDGASNTSTIVTALGNNGGTPYAAQLCQNLSVNGGFTSGWFLPAKDQLNTFYTNRVAIGNFSTNAYATSTESSSTDAWYQDFNSGGQNTAAKNNSVLYARCARTFIP